MKKVSHFFNSLFVLILTLLVVTGSGGVLLNVHTCLSQDGHYLHFFHSQGRCEHPGSCAADENQSLCCEIQESSMIHEPVGEILSPECCKDEVYQLYVDTFLNEQQKGRIIFSYWCLTEKLSFKLSHLSFDKEVCIRKLKYHYPEAELAKDRPAKLCVFLI